MTRGRTRECSTRGRRAAWRYSNPPSAPRDGFAPRPDAPLEPLITDPDYRPEPGTRFDRIGRLNGSFIWPEGTHFDLRSLPPDALGLEYHVLVVGDQPLPFGWRLELGPVNPWFEQPGGGMQIKIVPLSGFRGNVLEYLVDYGYFT